MAEIAISAAARLATILPSPEHQTAGKKAGEDLNGGEFVYYNTDGKVYKASGAAANAAALTVGQAPGPAKSGEGVTVQWGVNVRYSDGLLTPGTRYYLSGTVPGGLADAASTGGTVPVAYAVDAYRIHIFEPNR